MVTQDPTNAVPSDNHLLIEVSGLHVTGQPALNAVQVEIVDPAGRAQAIWLAVLLIRAHRRMVRSIPPAGPLSAAF